MTFNSTILTCVSDAVKPALQTGLWIIKIMVPVSFGVLLLKLTGLLPWIATLCAPLFALLGMPGESAVVFVTAALVNIYAGIGVMETLGFQGPTVTLLALMCLISHNLPVETAVQKKTGSSFWAMVAIRLGSSFIGAFIVSQFLQVDIHALSATAVDPIQAHWTAEISEWFIDMILLCTKILFLITLLMVLQRMMEAFGVIQRLADLLKYPLIALGLPRQTAFLWIVANTLGLAYGAGVIIDHVERGRLSRQDADLLNTHIAVSHSLLEDTLLFVAVGASAFWITVPRIVLAALVVWIKRLFYAVASGGAKVV